jgi:uncharacterized membrane protein YhhN
MKRICLYAFVLTAVIQLVSSLFEWQLADAVSKCLLLPLLYGYYISSRRPGSRMFALALAFCWAGDILLIFGGRAEIFFMGGLAAFLTGHLFYILAYRQHRTEESTGGLLVTQKIRYSTPVVLAGTGLYVVLFPMLGALKAPVLLYSVVIILMVMTALFRYGVTTPSSFWLVFCGAVLFMASDSILAINKFLGSVPMADFWIMLTYISAQFLIVEGIRRH